MILRGEYVQGIGRAHKFGNVYRPAFNCPMVATFNVRSNRPITEARPTKTASLVWPGEKPKLVTFWLCQINGSWAWAMRWDGSRLPATRIEFISKRPLPEHLKSKALEIEVFEKWSKAKILEWAPKQYQWQGFPWLPRQRVDSRRVWGAISLEADWSGADVLDVGSHYGYHSFRASEAGASVMAIEPNDDVRATGKIIARHIEMQDVQFEKLVCASDFHPPISDIILYLSVQHQWDPNYENLSETVLRLAASAKRILFVEVILPSLFGKGHSSEDIDEMVGGEILKTYRHRLRGIRRIYKVQGKA